MHIGYFSSIIGTQGGPAIVDKRILESIAKYDKKNNYTVYGLTEKAFTDLDVQNEKILFKQIKPSGKWLGIAFGLTHELKRRPVDLLHATFVAPPVVPCRFVVTLGCWSPYAEPEVYPPLVRWRLVYLLNKGITNATAIFVYTEYLKGKIIEKFNIRPERIFVVEPGVGEENKELDNDSVNRFLAGLGINDPYILFIGTLNKRKNVTRLVQAYSLLKRKYGIKHKLVLLGEQGYYFSEIANEIERLGLTKDVILTGRRPHHELPFFYNGADLFVFPTLSEGFGIPPIEAMACGTPVVASNVTSVPEVVGDAAYMIDPLNTDEMASAMYSCLTDQGLRADMIAKGKIRGRYFTWENAANKSVAAYETVYRSNW